MRPAVIFQKVHCQKTAPPAPTTAAASVISIFSDAYPNITGVSHNPDWGQETIVTEEMIGGGNSWLFSGLNYQGTDFAGNAQDVTGMTMLHLDYWTANSTDFSVFIISPGPV